MTLELALTAAGYLAEGARRRVVEMENERLRLNTLRRQADFAAQTGNDMAFKVLCEGMEVVAARIERLDSERIDFVKAVYQLRSRFTGQ